MAIGIVQVSAEGELTFAVFDGRGLRTLDRVRFAALYLDGIYFLPPSDHSLCYEVETPPGVERRNLKTILQEELRYRLPIELDEVVWGYREAARHKFILYVLKRGDFEDFLRTLREHGVCCDFICPQPTPAAAGELAKFTPVTMEIPKELRPARNRVPRLLYFLLLFLVLVVCIWIFNGKYQSFQTESRKLQELSRQYRQEQKRLQAEAGRLAADKDLYERIQGMKLNLVSTFPVFQELTTRLPEYMWVSNFVWNGDFLDITIESSRDEPNFYRLLAGAKPFEIVNLRKSRGARSAVVFYVKLKGGKQ